MSNPQMNFSINQDMPNEILGALIYPVKVFHSDYKNIDPVSLLEDGDKIEISDSEDNREYFISQKDVLKRQLGAIANDAGTTVGLEETLNSMRQAVSKSYKEFLGAIELKSLEIHYMDVYISKQPKVSFNNGKIELTDIEFRIDYKITGHIKTIFGRKSIVLQDRGAGIQASSSVALKTIGTKLFANIVFERLKLVLNFGFKFTLDLKKYLDPASAPFEIFDANTALLSIPSSKSKLAFRTLTPTVGNGELSVKSEFDLVTS